MKNDYEAPAVKVAWVALRSAILDVSGGYNPPIPDDD